MLDHDNIERVKSYGVAAGAMLTPVFLSNLEIVLRIFIGFVGLFIALLRLEHDWKKRQAKKNGA